ncbi:T3SS (YopN, CesT) and YbjN peptide-binding chaperone 1 [Rhodococcus marinonascens]|uniref:T3SS (YopN, CesT) and YbjN peptide-binding chaperone 1 n=1 Tax=Rhodococcus marinonascens TaxID=38311 RepID=UPI000933D153|nr:hypothetical protein [Rhodococcus marinonascens]
MQEFDLDSSVNHDWAQFQRRLADYLAAMQDEDLLVLESGFEELDESEGLSPCVQFLVWDGDTVRCELPSNHRLHPARRLSDAEQTYLTELGWNRPTRGPDDKSDDGSPAFYIDKKLSWSDQLAAMTVAAFRDVWGVPHPSFLSTETSLTDPAVPFDPIAVRPPLVEDVDPASAVLPRDVEHLQELIMLSLVPLLGLLPERDPDGDVPIRMGNTILFVGPVADSFDVQLFAPLIYDISDRTRAAEVTGDLNRTWSRIKFILVDDRLSAFLEVPGNPFVPQHLTDTCNLFSEFLETVDDEFSKRFGGKLSFYRDNSGDEEPVADTPMTAADLPKELLTLFHLDPGFVANIDPTAVADVCGHDRVRILTLLDTCTAWVTHLRDNDDSTAEHWERIVGALRDTLRTVVLPPTTSAPEPKPQPEQTGVFNSPEERTPFDDDPS